MRITRLEIFGFKSFVDRFVLNFDTELIGVVGPNGCGKSNIVDALRWVLGETHAKHLRGNVLEDLIFSGSETKRQLGMAEVTITIRPDEHWIDALESDSIDSSDEIEAGESSKPELVVIQGGVNSDEVSTEDSEETSNKTAKEVPATEQKQARQLPDSVLSIPGLLSASEIQLTRRLYRSGESEYFINKAPCRLKDLIDLYRAIGLGARGLSIVQQGHIGDIVKSKPKERRELLEEAAGIAGLRARLETSNRKLQKTSDNLERLKDIISEVEKQVRSLSRQAKRAEKRKILKSELLDLENKHYFAKISGIQTKKEELTSEDSSLKEEISSVINKLEALKSEQEGRKTELQKVESELLSERRKRDSLLSELNKTRKRESEIRVAVAKLESELTSLDGAKEKISLKKAEALEEENLNKENISQLSSQLEVHEKEKEGLEERLQAMAQSSNGEGSSFNTDVLEGRISNLFSELSLQKTNKHDIEKDLDSERSVISAREKSIASLKGEKQSIESHLRNLSCLLELDKNNNQNLHISESNDALEGKVFLEGLIIPEELEIPVSAVLGRSSSYTLLSKDKLNSFLESSEDVSNGLIVDLLPAASSSNLNSKLSSYKLLDNISVEPGFERVSELLLGNVILASSVKEACGLIEEASDPRVVAVTKDGSLVFPWGVQPSSKAIEASSKGQHLGMKRRLEEINELTQEKELELTELNTSLSSKQTELQAIASSLLQNDTLLAELHSEQRENLNKQKAIKEEALSKEREVRVEIQKILSVETSISSEMKFAEKNVERLKKEQELLEEEENKNSLRVTELNSLYQERSEQLKLDFEDESSTHKREAEEVESLLLELDKTIFQIEGSFDSKRQEIYSFQEEIRKHEQNNSSLKKREDALTLDLEKLDIEMSMTKEDAEEKGLEVSSLEEGDSRIESVLEEAKSSSLSFFISKVQGDIKEIKRKLEREGEVDPEVIERFSEESERLEELTVQYDDLNEARKTLARTISELRDVSNERFFEAFKFVSNKFSEMIPQLFGGGSGALTLEDPEDPLNSGVEMTVRPPGKKLQSIDLMSGGEKALAATAIIMSMFLYRPSPICVLDEVDAPLDDANLERFLAKIKEISKTTQFLIITHNKMSMAMANRLVGVTMEEKGISNALEVDLEEAEKVVVNA